jgi:hypothetical protein
MTVTLVVTGVYGSVAGLIELFAGSIVLLIVGLFSLLHGGDLLLLIVGIGDWLSITIDKLGVFINKTVIN